MATIPHVDRDALAREIASVALLRGTFTLRSGRTSSYYLDKYLFSTRPEVLSKLAALFHERLHMLRSAGIRIDRIAGAELGGIPLVTAAALQSGLPTVLVRNKKKDYGTSKQVEGAVNKGDSIVLLEDVATTGGQALEAVQTLRELGAEVPCVIATIDRLEGARETIEGAGVRFEALFTKRDLGVTE
ncbi:MAG: orotate phosphoribosyltransferase [Planctomycetota bacterium]|nr:orotate phosphoribosyltransferase [Planctomycetota bacterium]